MRAMAQRSAEVRRERKQQRETEAQLAHLTTRQRLGLSLAKVSQSDMDEVVAALVQRAKDGDTKAIHAMARLLDQSFGRAGVTAEEDGRSADEKSWQEMTPQERAAYRAALIAQVEKERAERKAAGDPTDPRSELTTD